MDDILRCTVGVKTAVVDVTAKDVVATAVEAAAAAAITLAKNIDIFIILKCY